MSIVTSVILCTSCGEGSWDRVNSWLADHGFEGLAAVEHNFSGNKASQMTVGGGAYFRSTEATGDIFNSVIETFITFVIGLPWDYPENVVLVVQPEDGPTRVERPYYDITLFFDQ